MCLFFKSKQDRLMHYTFVTMHLIRLNIFSLIFSCIYIFFGFVYLFLLTNHCRRNWSNILEVDLIFWARWPSRLAAFSFSRLLSGLLIQLVLICNSLFLHFLLSAFHCLVKSLALIFNDFQCRVKSNSGTTSLASLEPQHLVSILLIMEKKTSCGFLFLHVNKL